MPLTYNSSSSSRFIDTGQDMKYIQAYIQCPARWNIYRYTIAYIRKRHNTLQKLALSEYTVPLRAKKA